MILFPAALVNRVPSPARFSRRCRTQVGDSVRFRVQDIFLPSPEAVFAPLDAGAEVEGTILSFSDSGPRAQAFAVVEVVRRQSLIVPVEKLTISAKAL